MIDMDKKYTTRGGRAVRLLCVDGPGDQCVIGIVEGEDDPDTWTRDGIWRLAHDTQGEKYGAYWNLTPVNTKHEGWMPVAYCKDKDSWINGRIYNSREEAEAHLYMGLVCVAHVTWED